MNKYQSKIVTSDQIGPHENLIKIISKYSTTNFKRPISDFGHKTMEELLPVLSNYKKIILDTGCGTGESSYNLAIQNPDAFVLGVDKSQSRIERKNAFKKDRDICNFTIVRAELLDIWPLLYHYGQECDWKIVKQCLFYPNPWPKKKSVKLRWPASPIMPFLCAIGGEIDVRSNWKIYLEEMKVSLEYFTNKKFEVLEFKPQNPETLFEKKYMLSGQSLYQIKGRLD